MTRPVGEDDLVAWVDGRLAPDRESVVDAYLDKHSHVLARLNRQKVQMQGLAAALHPVADEPLPARLRVAAIANRPKALHWRAPIAASLLLSLGFGGGWLSAIQRSPPQAGIAALATEASDSYRVYASDQFRPAELGPGERESFVRWASGRIGARVSVPDLASSGYSYAGGRLVATPHGAAALLLYTTKDGDRLALLTRPMQIDKTARMILTDDRGLGQVSWAAAGVGFALVGDRPASSLHPIADEARRQLMRA